MDAWETRQWMLMGCAPTSPQVKVPMKFNGQSGVQLRAPRDLTDLAAYTALKFYLQSPGPVPGQVAGDHFVLYMGSRQVLGGLSRLAGAGTRLEQWVVLAPYPAGSPFTTGHW